MSIRILWKCFFFFLANVVIFYTCFIPFYVVFLHLICFSYLNSQWKCPFDWQLNILQFYTDFLKKVTFCHLFLKNDVADSFCVNLQWIAEEFGGKFDQQNFDVQKNFFEWNLHSPISGKLFYRHTSTLSIFYLHYRYSWSFIIDIFCIINAN